jgi:hypothetical protein
MSIHYSLNTWLLKDSLYMYNSIIVKIALQYVYMIRENDIL